MDDLISRQAAIDALNRHLDTIPVVNNNTMEMIRRSEVMDCREIINGLPSAEIRTEMSSANDTISRWAAIDAVCEYCEYCEYFYNEKVIQSIKKIPSVQPQRWIPVTERLPEHSGFYIVTAIVTDDGGKLVGLRWFSQEHGWKFGKNPLAWMPLPEPWRGGQDATN